jgi:hypothetical protein
MNVRGSGCLVGQIPDAISEGLAGGKHFVNLVDLSGTACAEVKMGRMIRPKRSFCW